ncbi:MAG: hypothetical protein ACRDIV_08705, partial [Ktedonobacteraceae bacterium]
IKRATMNAQVRVVCVWWEGSSSFSRGELRFACTLDKQHSIYRERVGASVPGASFPFRSSKFIRINSDVKSGQIPVANHPYGLYNLSWIKKRV